MAEVVLTAHLLQFFPSLAGRRISVEADTAAELVRAMDALAPGLAGYLVTERGALRPHVNLFISGEMVVDREGLSDPVPKGARVHLLQALSGG